MPDHGTGRTRRLLELFPVLLLLAFMAIAISSCGNDSPPPPTGSYTQPSDEDYSDLSWTEAFEKMHEKISREYAFTEWKGISWKAQYKRYRPMVAKAQESNDQKSYYLALREYLQELRDGHVNIAPDDPAVLREMAGGGFGLIAVKLDNGKVVASWIKAGGPADNAGIQQGAQLLEWDDKKIEKALANTSTVLGPSQPTDARVSYEQQRFLVRAPVDADRAVTFRNPGDDEDTAVTLKAVDDGMETLSMTDSRSIFARGGELPESMIEARVLAGNVGYVRILAEVDLPEQVPGDHTTTVELFRKAIDGFMDGKVRGIIVDIRGNSGGSDQMVADFMSSFYEDSSFYEYQNYIVPDTGEFEIWIADDETGEYTSPGEGIHIEPGARPYPGPVVALVDNGCISSGEGIAMGIKRLPNGKVVGFLGTNGSFGMAGDAVQMPGGYAVSWPFGQSLDKNRVVQIDSRGGKGGIMPNASIPMTLENALKISAGKDVVLDNALKTMTLMKKTQ